MSYMGSVTPLDRKKIKAECKHSFEEDLFSWTFDLLDNNFWKLKVIVHGQKRPKYDQKSPEVRQKRSKVALWGWALRRTSPTYRFHKVYITQVFLWTLSSPYVEPILPLSWPCRVWLCRDMTFPSWSFVILTNWQTKEAIRQRLYVVPRDGRFLLSICWEKIYRWHDTIRKAKIKLVISQTH